MQPNVRENYVHEHLMRGADMCAVYLIPRRVTPVMGGHGRVVMMNPQQHEVFGMHPIHMQGIPIHNVMKGHQDNSRIREGWHPPFLPML